MTGGSGTTIRPSNVISNSLGVGLDLAGANTATGKTIIANTGHGVQASSSNFVIQNNLIGVDSGGAARPDGGSGVLLAGGTCSSMIGAPPPDCTTVRANTFKSNRIFQNAGAGIAVNGGALSPARARRPTSKIRGDGRSGRPRSPAPARSGSTRCR